jgi:tRNA-2-methylthio-N6-dimethylallyladenosine synthase
MTSHPRDMGDDLIEAHASEQKLMPFLHLPVQSGSDGILEAMNRGHSREDYRRLIARIRAARPDIALSSDFIVGFPGENDSDFEDTLELVRETGFAQAYTFKYSPRPGTPAASARGQIPEDVKSLRLERLQTLLLSQAAQFAAVSVGKTLDVLLEKPGRHTGQIIGRSQYLQSVHVMAPEMKIGDIVRVKVIAAMTNSLKAEIVPEFSPRAAVQ